MLCHEDESRRSGLPKQGQERICHADCSNDVHGEAVTECVAGGLLLSVYSCVVDEDIETAVSGGYGRGCGIHRFVRCYVDLDGGDCAFEGGRDFRALAAASPLDGERQPRMMW
jgi:hypothetical protein